MRMYYDCPIKALYMSREFGVKFYFIYEDEKTLAIRGIDNFLAYISNPIDGVKFYVNEVSEAIFQLQEGDDIIASHNIYSIATEVVERGFLKDKDVITLEQANDFEEKEIIMRRDRHFFTPLTEQD